MRILGLLLVTCVLGGCARWSQTGASPRAVITGARPPEVRITRADGDRLIVARPVIARDSIFGTSEVGLARMHVAEVRLMEVERFSPGRTLALIVAHAGAVVGFVALIVDLLPHYRGL
jgi:hypothetical protein